MTRNKVLFCVCLAIGITLMATSLVLAYAQQTNPDFAGVTDAVAMKDVVVVDAFTWNGRIRSYTTNPVYDIGTIGFTWWTFRETCDGNIIDNWVQSGYVEYGDSDVLDIGVDDRDPCSGSHLGWSLGTHDFKHGGDTWRPNFSTSEGI